MRNRDFQTFPECGTLDFSEILKKCGKKLEKPFYCPSKP